jgi:hypothetical protein
MDAARSMVRCRVVVLLAPSDLPEVNPQQQKAHERRKNDKEVHVGYLSVRVGRDDGSPALKGQRCWRLASTA